MPLYVIGTFDSIGVMVSIFMFYKLYVKSKLRERKYPNTKSKYIVDLHNREDGWTLENFGVDKFMSDIGLSVLPNESMDVKITNTLNKVMSNRIIKIIENGDFKDFDEKIADVLNAKMNEMLKNKGSK